MGTFSLVGNDTVKINDRIFSDFGSGEVAKISYDADIGMLKTGKNGNSIISQNASGFSAMMELKVIRGSADDKYLQTELSAYRKGSTSYVLMNGELTKNIGDGKGLTIGDTYILTGGFISKQTEVVYNVEGDTEQALTAYTIRFSYCDRVIS